MEPVSQDFVEQTADFMMHLTKNQLDERVDELKKRQFNIYNIVSIGMNSYNEPAKRDYVFRMALIIIRVMESYEAKLPMISLESIKEVIKIINKPSKFENKGVSDEQQLQNKLDEIGQPHYIDYLKEMVSSDLVYQSIFSHDESHNNFFIMTTIASIYKYTIERYS